MSKRSAKPTTTHDHDAIIATIAKEYLGLETLESRHQDRLDFQEHSCMAIRDALRAAFEAGRQSTRRRAEKKRSAIVGDIALTSAMPKTASPHWATGRVGAFGFCAKVFAEHAVYPSFEIGRSRISKLELHRLDDNAVVYAWDRGLVMQATDAEAQAAVDTLVTHLADHLYGPAH
jgi:hypothetical protein